MNNREFAQDRVTHVLLTVKNTINMARIKEEKGFVLMTLIGMDIGSANYGVCASEGTLRMTVRAEKESIFEEYVSRIRALAEAEAEADGLAIKIEEIERFPATENCDEACDIAMAAANANGYAVLQLEEPMRWSEDFGTYLKTCDGAFFGIGDGCEYAQLHTENYEFPDEITETALNMFAEIL